MVAKRQRASQAVQIERPPEPFIQCCFQNCTERATIRMHTKTGWANVCRTHYPHLERAPVIARNPTVDAIREKYRRSFAFNKTREPGSDDE